MKQEPKDYLVTWAINLEGSDPVEVAKQALEIMRDPNSTAQHFMLVDNEGWTTDIDLLEKDPLVKGPY